MVPGVTEKNVDYKLESLSFCWVRSCEIRKSEKKMVARPGKKSSQIDNSGSLFT